MLKSKKKVQTAGTSRIFLPTKFSEPDEDFQNYVTLIYGQSGVGKTTLCASWPDNVFLPTEPGTRGLRRKEIPADGKGIRNWREFKLAVKLLIDTYGSNGFKTITVDTVDRAYEYAMDDKCRELGIEHISETTTGKTDRSGKGWTALKKEFTDTLFSLVQAGYGLVLTSHSKVVSVTRHNGEEYDLIQPSCAGQALDVVKKITDCIFYCEHVKAAGDEKVQRIMITQGDDLVLAKARGGSEKGWPRYLPMLKEDGYGLICRAFAGKYEGLDPETIIASKQTTTPAQKSISMVKAKSRMKGGGKGLKKLR